MHAEIQTPTEWQLEINPPPAVVEALRENLRRYNREAGGVYEGLEMGIFLRDEQQELTAGITAWLWGKTVEIDFLWVSDGLRGQGIGEALLTRIEMAARERGATQAYLSTFSFQAPEFYQRRGYEIAAVIEGLGDDHKKFFLRKSL